MKASTVIGVLSLAANGALLGVILVGAASPAAKTPAAVSRPAVAAKPGESAPAADLWAQMSAADLAAQRDRLQADGFPPSAVRALLAAQIRERSAARRKAIETALADLPFWKNPIPDLQAQAQLRAIVREEQNALKELLGPDPVNSLAARLRRQVPELPAEKVDILAEIRERYDDQRSEIYGAMRGGMIRLTPAEQEKVAALDRAMHNEFASVLTPAELEIYDLRMSNTANNLRYNLAKFEPTETEFRALYRLQSAFDEQFNGMPYSTQDQMKARSDANTRLQEQIAAALGPQRYPEYQRASDYNFRQTSLLVERLGLPAETATALYAVQKDAEDRRNEIYRSTTAETRDQMLQKLAALHAEATKRVETLLGGKTTTVDAYRQYGGSWLANLQPRPAPKK